MPDNPSQNPILSVEFLAEVGIQDIPRANSILEALRGWGPHAEAFDEMLPALRISLLLSPDPDMALVNFDRWQASLTNRLPYYRFLCSNPKTFEIFFTVCATSQFFSEILIAQPELFEFFSDPDQRSRVISTTQHYREAHKMIKISSSYAMQLNAIRRYKRREVLRIGVMDILGTQPLPVIARALSDFADAMTQVSFEVAQEYVSHKFQMTTTPPFAVIAMGKHGGRELNYSSDIDLMFVYDDTSPVSGKLVASAYSDKLAQEIVNVLSKATELGMVFRVDLRLRPEGRYGSPSRSLVGCANYYENWAESWERQALIKARFVAGDPDLGARFMQLAQETTYRRTIPKQWVDDIHLNKQRIEQSAVISDVQETNVKIGLGGIRDVEFTVQLMQLLTGGRHPALRTGNTLEALDRLCLEGFLKQDEASAFAEGYTFMRTVEHRLQILYEQQTQTLPKDERALTLLARRMGFVGTDDFMTHYNTIRTRVRTLFEQLFYGEMADRQVDAYTESMSTLLSNIQMPIAQKTLVAMLSEVGFRDTERALHLLQIPVTGMLAPSGSMSAGAASPQIQQHFLKIAPKLIAFAQRSPDPDAALLGIETLSVAAPSRAHLYQVFNDSPEVLRRLVHMAGCSPSTINTLASHQELLDVLFSEEIVESRPKGVHRLKEELYDRLPRRGTPPQKMLAVASFIRRERIRIVARDLWGEVSGPDTAHEITNLYEAVLDTLLEIARRQISNGLSVYEQKVLDTVSIIGLGKLGGHEMGYSSDLDIMFTFEQPEDVPHNVAYQTAAKMCELVLSMGKMVEIQGESLELDARLRPEGRFGAIARTPGDYEGYYASRGETWERMSLVKARAIGGNSDTIAKWMKMANEAVYGRSLSQEELVSIRAVKKRVENERLKPQNNWSDLKLGAGGMIDIEFTTQSLQLKHGHENPSVQRTSTIAAINALRTAKLIAAADARAACRSYEICTKLRNAMNLYFGRAIDNLPTDTHQQAIIARMLHTATVADGAAVEQTLIRELDQFRKEVRDWVERDLYGRNF
ncbi:MAG: bifunctional [glutamine synthetase] adenylyltransferase/[glutamine synthetase]-adenylyl-L-tyrosine phosphorylase [Armatimonadota bacterium]